MGELRVVEAGPQLLVQDLGRPGHAWLGVPRSGALDAPALRLANRLVGNSEGAAGLEVMGGPTTLVADLPLTVAVTGAVGRVGVGPAAARWGAAVRVPAGARLRVGPAVTGLRSYVAVAGGLLAREVLGSRSTDLLGGLGPAPLHDGDVVPVGPAQGRPSDVEAVPRRSDGVLRLRPGPRDDWLDASWRVTLSSPYAVLPASNRIGLRLSGPALSRVREGELRSEGMALGSVQVPPDGQPVVFLADHPTTGGYPVVGVVDTEDLWQCAQLRPGDRVRFRVVG